MKTTVLVLLLFPLLGISQVSIDTCYLEGRMFIGKDSNGEYLYHLDWRPCHYTAIINVNNNAITIIRDTEIAIYTIEKAFEPLQDVKRNLSLKFTCKDNKGIRCGIGLITLAEPIDDYQSMLKIEYNNATIVYRYKDKTD